MTCQLSQGTALRNCRRILATIATTAACARAIQRFGCSDRAYDPPPTSRSAVLVCRHRTAPRAISMNRVLVTGASGFLGNWVARLLAERGWEVIGVSGSGQGEFSKLDLLDADAVTGFLRRTRPSHLVHAAWMPVHGEVMHSSTNLSWLTASIRLAERFREFGGRRAAFIGTCAEYDWTEGICRQGVTPLRPATIYGECKNALHLALSEYSCATGLEFVWPRVFFVYGPGENETRLVASVIRSLVRGEPAECTHGRQVRDYAYVADVARGIVLALESDRCGAIDLSSGRGIAVRELVAAVAREVGRQDLVRFGARPAPAHDVDTLIGDPARRGTCPRVAPRDFPDSRHCGYGRVGPS